MEDASRHRQRLQEHRHPRGCTGEELRIQHGCCWRTAARCHGPSPPLRLLYFFRHEKRRKIIQGAVGQVIMGAVERRVAESGSKASRRNDRTWCLLSCLHPAPIDPLLRVGGVGALSLPLTPLSFSSQVCMRLELELLQQLNVRRAAPHSGGESRSEFSC
jgi:hypothetical protein